MNLMAFYFIYGKYELVANPCLYITAVMHFRLIYLLVYLFKYAASSQWSSLYSLVEKRVMDSFFPPYFFFIHFILQSCLGAH